MNKDYSLLAQISHHAVAIISLIIAITALLYTTWRDEETEKNRNTRTAAFEVLKNLGELQLIVNNEHFQKDSMTPHTLMGWGRIALIGDLAQLLPSSAEEQANKLVEIWKNNANDLDNENKVDQISQQIDTTRITVIQSLRHLK